MSVLVFAENLKGICKKASFEALTFGHHVAQSMGTDCHAVTIGQVNNIADLGKYGAAKIHQINADSIQDFDGQTYGKALSALAKEIGASVVIMGHSSQGKSLAGRIAIRLNAGLVSAVNALPETEGGFSVTKSLFSGKAIAKYNYASDVKVMTLVGNSMAPQEINAAGDAVASGISLEASKINVLETKTVEGIVPLPEAELVVSAGRGMKGP